MEVIILHITLFSKLVVPSKIWKACISPDIPSAQVQAACNAIGDAILHILVSVM